MRRSRPRLQWRLDISHRRSYGQAARSQAQQGMHPRCFKHAHFRDFDAGSGSSLRGSVCRGFDCTLERWADEGGWRAVALQFVVIELAAGVFNMRGLARKFNKSLFVISGYHVRIHSCADSLLRIQRVPLTFESFRRRQSKGGA